MTEATDSERPNKGLREIGNTAWHSLVIIVVALVLLVSVAGLGFLVYAQRLTAEPFLLLVGIIVGFILGRAGVVF